MFSNLPVSSNKKKVNSVVFPIITEDVKLKGNLSCCNTKCSNLLSDCLAKARFLLIVRKETIKRTIELISSPRGKINYLEFSIESSLPKCCKHSLESLIRHDREVNKNVYESKLSDVPLEISAPVCFGCGKDVAQKLRAYHFCIRYLGIENGTACSLIGSELTCCRIMFFCHVDVMEVMEKANSQEPSKYAWQRQKRATKVNNDLIFSNLKISDKDSFLLLKNKESEEGETKEQSNPRRSIEYSSSDSEVQYPDSDEMID